MNVDEAMWFWGSDSSCAGKTFNILPADGTVGTDAGCTDFDGQAGGTPVRFKISGCEPGTVSISIFDGATLIQTIWVTVLA